MKYRKLCKCCRTNRVYGEGKNTWYCENCKEYIDNLLIELKKEMKVLRGVIFKLKKKNKELERRL